MNQWVVPSLNLGHQRTDDEQTNPSQLPDQNLYPVPMQNNSYEVAELTWENGQLALHGFGGSGNTFPSPQTDPSWTVESMFHLPISFNSQISDVGGYFPAACNSGAGGKWEENGNGADKQLEGNLCPPLQLDGKWKANTPNLSPELLKLNPVDDESMGRQTVIGGLMKKRRRVKSLEVEERASATFSRDLRAKTAFESAPTFKISGRNMHSQDCSETKDEERVNKEEGTSRSTARRGHAASLHNQSERRRRDRINEKMRALQKLVPNASKTDKASMLDEVIDHLKQLQSHIQVMSNARNYMSQMMMPLTMQQQQQQQFHLQMSMLTRMGIGMGMFDTTARNLPQFLPPFMNPTSSLCGTSQSFIPPPYIVPPMVPHLPPFKTHLDSTPINSSVPFNNVNNTFIEQQSMNMDFFNKMGSSVYQQPANHKSKMTLNLSRPTDERGN